MLFRPFYLIQIIVSMATSNFNISDLRFKLKDGNESYGRVEIQTPSGPLRASEEGWNSSSSYHVCRKLGFTTGYAVKKFFGHITANKNTSVLITLRCQYNFHKERSWCDSYSLKTVENVEDFSQDVWIRCIGRSEIIRKHCKDKVGDRDLVCESKLGRYSPDKMINLGTIIQGRGHYTIQVNCEGVRSDEQSTYECNTPEPCNRMLKLYCGEPCFYKTSSPQGRIFFNESAILENTNLPNVCAVDVELISKHYVAFYVVQLKLQPCQNVAIIPQGDCFGDINLMEEWTNKSTRFFRLFDCSKFTVRLLNHCHQRFNGYFELEYISQLYDPFRPKSSIAIMSSGRNLTLKCGFYYQNEDEQYMPMVLINLTKPFKRDTVWLFDDLLGSKQIEVKKLEDWDTLVNRSNHKGRSDFATGMEHFTNGVYEYEIEVTRDRNPFAYVGAYSCRQAVFHGPKSELVWSAEVIAIYADPDCKMNQRTYIDHKVFVASCKVGYVGRFAPVARFFLSNISQSRLLIFNHTDDEYASYKLLVFVYTADMENMPNEFIHIRCYLDYITPVENIPTYNDELVCSWSVKADRKTLKLKDNDLASFMALVITVFLGSGLINIIFLIGRMTLHLKMLASSKRRWREKGKKEKKEIKKKKKKVRIDVDG